MTHDIYFVKTRTNKQKQTHVLRYVNDGCGLNNCYSIKCNKQGLQGFQVQRYVL